MTGDGVEGTDTSKPEHSWNISLLNSTGLCPVYRNDQVGNVNFVVAIFHDVATSIFHVESVSGKPTLVKTLNFQPKLIISTPDAVYILTNLPGYDINMPSVTKNCLFKSKPICVLGVNAIVLQGLGLHMILANSLTPENIYRLNKGLCAIKNLFHRVLSISLTESNSTVVFSTRARKVMKLVDGIITACVTVSHQPSLLTHSMYDDVPVVIIRGEFLLTVLHSTTLMPFRTIEGINACSMEHALKLLSKNNEEDADVFNELAASANNQVIVQSKNMRQLDTQCSEKLQFLAQSWNNLFSGENNAVNSDSKDASCCPQYADNVPFTIPTKRSSVTSIYITKERSLFHHSSNDKLYHQKGQSVQPSSTSTECPHNNHITVCDNDGGYVICDINTCSDASPAQSLCKELDHHCRDHFIDSLQSEIVDKKRSSMTDNLGFVISYFTRDVLP